MNKKFNLKSEVISEIVFYMENQDQEAVFDLEEEKVVPLQEEDEADEDNFVGLPDWSSRDGFALMECFCGECNNLQIKEALLNELNAHKKGVFRRFKGVLENYPVYLNKWYVFKDEKMIERIKQWYQELSGEDVVKNEFFPEEMVPTEALLLEDFTIKYGYSNYKEEIEEILNSYKNKYSLISSFLENSKNEESLVALDTNDKVAAFILFTFVNEKKVQVLFYYVKEEFRGMGLFNLLLSDFNAGMKRRKVDEIEFPIVDESPFIEKIFEKLERKNTQKVFSYSLENWISCNGLPEKIFLF
ncbi:MAG: UPF0158 family protein [Sphaerochaetaceae bacterium]